MKKLLTILTLTAITMTALFAASTDVQLKTDVPVVGATFELRYGEKVIEGETNELVMNHSLAEIGTTDKFTLYVTSNYDFDQNLKVTVKPEEFILIREGVKVHSHITPKVMELENNTLETIPAGVRTNYRVSAFHLSWDGTKQAKENKLDAGDYVSNVKIEYLAK